MDIADVLGVEGGLTEVGAFGGVPGALMSSIAVGAYASNLDVPESTLIKNKGMSDIVAVTPAKRARGPDEMQTGPNPVDHVKANTMLGERPGLGGILKTRHSSGNNTNYSDKVLYSRPLIKIPYNSDMTRRDTRSWNLVDLKGINYKMNLKLGVGASDTEVYVLRWWFLGNTETMNAFDSDNDLPVAEFWHDPCPSTANGNGIAFTAAQPNLLMMNYNVNKRKYNVIKSGYKYLTKRNDTTNAMSDFFLIDEYIPFNRQLEFTASIEDYPDEANVWFAFIIFKRNKISSEDTPTALKAFGTYEYTIYHRTPQNYLL